MKTLLKLSLLVILSLAAPTAQSAPRGGQHGEQLSGALSLGTVDNRFTFGPRFFLDFPVNFEGTNFRMGGETGFLFASQNSTTHWSIPLLFTGSYNFKSDLRSISPYLAASTGLTIDHWSRSGLSDTSIHFALLVRPGFHFGEEQCWFAELPLGVMNTGFALLPTVGVRF